MANWKILLVASIIFFILASISFGDHLRTPSEKRTEGINQPSLFIFAVSIGVAIMSILFFFLDK